MLFAISNERSWSLLSSGGLLKLGIHKSAWVSLCFTLPGTDLDILDILDDFGVHQSVQVKHPWCLARLAGLAGALRSLRDEDSKPKFGNLQPFLATVPATRLRQSGEKSGGRCSVGKCRRLKMDLSEILSQMLHGAGIFTIICPNKITQM